VRIFGKATYAETKKGPEISQTTLQAWKKLLEGKAKKLPGDGMDLLRLGLGNVPGVNPCKTPPMPMNIHHDTVRFLLTLYGK
jgi:hypothetical protein